MLSGAIRKRQTCLTVVWFSACLLFSFSALAQTQQQKAAPPAAEKQTAPQQNQATPSRPSWVVNCVNQDAGLVCNATQTVILRQGQRIIRVNALVGIDPKTEQPKMLIQLPLGVYLPAGVTLTLGSSKAKVLVFETCNPNGCLAEHPITPAEIKTLVEGEDIKLAVRAADKSAFEFDVPSKGFAAAYAKVIDK